MAGTALSTHGTSSRPSELVSSQKLPTPLRRGFLLSAAPMRCSDLSARCVAADFDRALLEVDPYDGTTGLVGPLDHHLVGNGVPGRSDRRPRRPIVAVTNVFLRLGAVGLVAADHPGLRRLLIAEPLVDFGSVVSVLAVVASERRSAQD